MTPAERLELRTRIDQARRQLVQVTPEDCGEAASESSYNHGCRCTSCRRQSNIARTRRRSARLAEERLRDREYRRRRRLEAAA